MSGLCAIDVLKTGRAASGDEPSTVQSLYQYEKPAAERKRLRLWKSSVRFDARAGDGKSIGGYDPSESGTGVECYGSLAWLFCGSLEPKLKRGIAVQSYNNWKNTAADWARGGDAVEAQRFCCQK